MPLSSFVRQYSRPFGRLRNSLHPACGIIPIFLLTICACSAFQTFAAPYVVDLGGRRISRLKSDPDRPYVYGLNTGAAGQNASLVAFDAETGQLAKELSLAEGPSDLDITPDGEALFVIHFPSDKITKVNLSSFSVAGTRNLPSLSNNAAGDHYDLEAGPQDLLYFTDAAWAPTLHIFDFGRGVELGTFNPNGDGIGGLALNKDGRTLYTWRQYGWSAGVIGSWISRIDSSTSNLAVKETSTIFPERDPLDTPALLTASEDRLIHKSRLFEARNLSRVLTSFRENIYAISMHGDLAVGTTRVFNGRTGESVYILPFPTTISAVSGSQKHLFLVSQSTGKLGIVPIRDIADIPGPGLSPTPRDGEAVSSKLSALAWTSSPIASRYEVYLGTNEFTVRDAETNSPVHLGTTSELSLPIAPLQFETTYFWRVDSVGLTGVKKGTVWKFQLAPILVSPGTIEITSLAGYAPAPVNVTIEAGLGRPSWTAMENISWLSVSPTNSTAPTNILLTLSTEILAPGFYTNAVRFSSGSFAFDVPIQLTVLPMSLTKMVADLERPFIYALQAPVEGSSLASLVVINTQTEKIEKVLPMGSNLTDLSISYPEGMLYVTDWGHTPAYVVDLNTLERAQTLPLGTDAFKINAGRPGRIFTEGFNQWINIIIYDTLTGSEIGRGFVREGDGEVDPSGNYYYHCDNNSSNARIQKYRISEDKFEPVASSLEHPFGSRNLLLSGDGARLFWRGYIYDSNLNELGNLGEEVHACTLRGELAFGLTNVFNSANGKVLYKLPSPSAVKAVSGDQKKLFSFNSTSKQIEVIPMSNIAEVSGPELQPAPREQAVVSLPLAQLSWTTSPSAVRYDIYFGTNSEAVATATRTSKEFFASTTGTSVPAPSPLELGRSYYWRVDAVGLTRTVPGAVWKFQVAPIIISPQAVTVRAVTGAPVPPVSVRLEGSTNNFAWSVAESVPWIETEAVLNTFSLKFNTDGLPAGSYATGVKVTFGGLSFDLPVTLELFNLSLSKMLTDPQRPYIYGLHPGTGTFDDAFLLFINSDSEQIEKVIPIGANPTDLSLSLVEKRLYISNWQRNRTRVVDLVSQSELPSLSLGTDVYKINAGRSGRLYAEGQDQWINISIFDTLTGSEIGKGFVREGDGEVDPTGTYYYHCDNNISNAHIQKYRITEDKFESVASSVEHAYGSRNLIMSSDGRRLFWRGFIYDSDLRELGGFGEEIYACTRTGSFAFSATKAYETDTRKVNFQLPFSTTVSAVSSDSRKLFLFDPTAKRLSVLPMDQIINRPPAAENQVVTAAEDAPAAFTAGASDPEGDALRFLLLTSPRNGKLSGEPPRLTYIPNTNFFGADTFTFAVSDRWRTSSVATVTITVASVNDAPVAHPQSVGVVAGRPKRIELAGSDVEGDKLNFAVGLPPQHGTLSGIPPMIFYLPEPGYIGEDSFTFAVSDDFTGSTPAKITLQVGPPSCFDGMAKGLLAWWPAEGNGWDRIGGTEAEQTNVSFTPGVAGQAFQLSGTNSFARIPPNPALVPSKGNFTVEGWFKTEDLVSSQTLLSLGRSPGGWLQLVLAGSGTNVLASLGLNSTLPAGPALKSSPNVISKDFHHLALVHSDIDKRFALYLDGRIAAEQTVPGFAAAFNGEILIGRSPAPALDLFKGSIDELSVFDAALTPFDVESLYLAGAAAKCAVALPPAIFAQPANATVLKGTNLTLAAAVRGSAPIHFQWLFQGRALAGANAASLEFTNITVAQAGLYSLIASNAYGTASSSVAVNVQEPPALVNGSFETGDFKGWIVTDIVSPYVPLSVRRAGFRPSTGFFQTSPTDGSFCAVHGFEGAGPGLIRIAQEVRIPEGRPVLTFDYRVAWNLRTAKYSRLFAVTIEPSGGGNALDVFPILTLPVGTLQNDTGARKGLLDLSAHAGKSVRLSFDAEVSEAFSGPGLLQLDNVNLSIAQPPVIVAQPAGGIVAPGVTVRFESAAEGTSPLGFQWQRDGVDLAGATGASLTLTNVAESMRGSYRVVVTNAFGMAMSAEAAIALRQPGELGIPVRAPDQSLFLSFAALPGKTYMVEASSDLIQWSLIGNAQMNGDKPATFVDPQARQHATRFYRLRLLGN
jgi:hypothetical protein